MNECQQVLDSAANFQCSKPMDQCNARELAKATLKATVATLAVIVTVFGPLICLFWVLWSQKLTIFLLGGFFSCEACFAVYYFYVIVKEFNKVPEQHAPADYQADAVVKQFLAHIARVQDIKHYLSAWFLDVPFESIRLENVRELCAYALWYKNMDQMHAEGVTPQLDDVMFQLQAMHGISLPPGYNPDLRFMSHLWDEVPHIYRPLFFYLAMEFLELITWAMLLINGFKKRQIKVAACKVVYYTKGLKDRPQQQQQQQQREEKRQLPVNNLVQQDCQQQQQIQLKQTGSQVHKQNGQQGQHHTQLDAPHSPTPQKQQQRQQQHKMRQPGSQNPHHHQQQQQGEDVSKVPLVVLHGVGAGLMPYLGVVFTLAATGRPLICPVWKHVSMRLTRYIPTVDDGAAVTLAAMRHHGVQQAAVIGHSYGTCIAARLVKQHPEVVHTLALIDPVCFAMYMPNLVKFFLYSCHLSGSLLVDGMIALLSSEIHCARNFCRNFFWTSINMWDEHLPDRTLVVLSGCDLLSPTLYVRDWLENHTKAKVLYNPTASHGAGLLLNLEWQRTILANLLQLLQSPSSAGAVAVGVGDAGQEGVDVSPGAAATAAVAEPGEERVAAAGTVSNSPSSAGEVGAVQSCSTDSREGLLDLYGGSDATVDVGYAFDGDEFVGDEFDAMFDSFWGSEGFGGSGIVEMFDAVHIDKLWDAAASATNSLVAGVVSVVRTGSSIALSSSYSSINSSSRLHQRRKGDQHQGAAGADSSSQHGVVGCMSQCCKDKATVVGSCDQHTMVKCQ